MKKLSIIILSKNKIIICSIFLFIFILLLLIPFSNTASVPKTEKIIVIDAGHGGIDGGSVGVLTKNDENHLNLEYAKCLKQYCENFGIGVVMTRTTLDGLYSITSKNKKKDDMQKRKEIIDNSCADLVISIHMNSFSTKSSNGAQVFYKKENKCGKELADCIQEQFISLLPNAKKTTKSGDYFMVNCTELPSVIVECGYLSNTTEDKLLSTNEYKQKVCYSIFCGILMFYGTTNV